MSSREFKVASRSSRLALIQAQEAAGVIRRLLPGLSFRVLPGATPGDRDRSSDLRSAPADFFTRDLHLSVLDGSADCAVHSAKDLEDPLPEGMDWFWIPGGEDPRDVLILRAGEDLPSPDREGTAGVSSLRREEYCRRRFPGMTPKSVRGNIEERLARLDAGEYDLLVLAGAGLLRLGLPGRISRWIPREELETPEGQGRLALTFRLGDRRFNRIRSLFVRPVVFAGAGAGAAGNCTLAARSALERCDICFYDRLLDPALLEFLSPGAVRVDVGKRCGDHSVSQEEINARLAAAARRGKAVVRLKGGDPGLFGRLSEEIAVLDRLELPYRVIPGVSSPAAATTGTGMLPTRRGGPRGFTVITPRERGGGLGSIRRADRAGLPLVLLMATGVLDEVAAQLKEDGLPASTPAAVVYDAGSGEETVVRGTLDELGALRPEPGRPGVVIVGSPAAEGYRQWGALGGRRVLLPGSEALREKASSAVFDLGGVPLPLPLIRLVPEPAARAVLKEIARFDWLAVTSPSAARILLLQLAEAGVDLRSLPRLLVAGPGTAGEFKSRGIVPDLVPEEGFGGRGLLAAARRSLPPGASILRLRSDAAGAGLSRRLAGAGFAVTDQVLYRNRPVRPERVPPFDAVLFTSGSTVKAFFNLNPLPDLAGKTVIALGPPTRRALESHGFQNILLPPEATVASAIKTLAAEVVGAELEAGL